ncbi:hypothetical protein OSB04_009606 [Centaurea solstitialis]|uniref:Uncharacterized protein n=1 Tax=Centaurea solstitialis TaxID=347529 RepID=A0AA38WB32_9ASTR|nr:hypothetical protein OSB04_009606 [Centaurea solstitialis]
MPTKSSNVVDSNKNAERVRDFARGYPLLAVKLEGKVAIVTGGASGLGESTVRLFAKQGAKVLIADVQDDLGLSLSNELVSEHGHDIVYIHCDVTQDSQVKNVVDTAIDKYGRLDIMFNNAGIPGSLDFTILDTDYENFKRVFDVNVFGSMLGAKHAARVMIPAKRGVILFTSSSASVVAGESPHSYTVSKHAIVGLMKNLCVELGQHGIRVNCISPGSVSTPLLTNAMGVGKAAVDEILCAASVLKEVVPTAEDVAEAALYLGGDSAKFVTGINLVVDGGYSTTNPTYSNVLKKTFGALTKDTYFGSDASGPVWEDPVYGIHFSAGQVQALVRPGRSGLVGLFNWRRWWWRRKCVGGGGGGRGGGNAAAAESGGDGGDGGGGDGGGGRRASTMEVLSEVLHEVFTRTSTVKHRLEGKVAIVTGGASGFGESTVRLFAKQGAKVLIADVQDDLGLSLSNELVSEHGHDVTYIHCDVTQDSHVKNVVDTAIDKYGRLDIMFNNAGIPGSLDFTILDTEYENFKRVFDVNVFGSLLGAKHAARVMIPAKRGVILFTSSSASVVAGESPHSYTVSKHAVVGLMKNLCVELGQYGIRVNCISPGSVSTPLLTNAMGVGKAAVDEIVCAASVLKGVVPAAEDVAEAALYLGSDSAKFVTGINLVVDGGYSTTNPTYTNVLKKTFGALTKDTC